AGLGAQRGLPPFPFAQPPPRSCRRGTQPVPRPRASVSTHGRGQIGPSVRDALHGMAEEVTIEPKRLFQVVNADEDATPIRRDAVGDRKSTRLNSSHDQISY